MQTGSRQGRRPRAARGHGHGMRAWTWDVGRGERVERWSGGSRTCGCDGRRRTDKGTERWALIRKVSECVRARAGVPGGGTCGRCSLPVSMYHVPWVHLDAATEPLVPAPQMIETPHARLLHTRTHPRAEKFRWETTTPLRHVAVARPLRAPRHHIVPRLVALHLDRGQAVSMRIKGLCWHQLHVGAAWVGAAIAGGFGDEYKCLVVPAVVGRPIRMPCAPPRGRSTSAWRMLSSADIKRRTPRRGAVSSSAGQAPAQCARDDEGGAQSCHP